MLDSIKNVFKNPNVPLILVVSILFIAVSIYFYFNYVKPLLNKKYDENKEYIAKNENENKVADIYFFYTTWCPHCKKAKPIWANFKSEIKGKKINGWKINFKEIDCEKEDTVADKFDVDEYPTIKLVRGHDIIEYDARPNKDQLIKFLNEML